MSFHYFFLLVINRGMHMHPDCKQSSSSTHGWTNMLQLSLGRWHHHQAIFSQY